MVLYFFVVLEAGGLEVLLGGFGGRRGCFFEAPRVSWAPFWHLLGASGRPFLEDFGSRKRTSRDDRLEGGGRITPPYLWDKKMEKMRPGGTRKSDEKVT